MTKDLRSRAEALLEMNPVAKPSVSTIDAQRVVHELQVHQVELEMQNDELQRAQLELAQSRDAYVELYDYAPVGYLTLDGDGVILEGNHTIAGMLGVARGALVGRTFAQYVDRSAQDQWFQHHRRAQASEEKRTVALALRRVDRGPMMVRLECRPQPGETPPDWRCLVAVIDISAQQRAENALREAHDNLEALVETRTQALHESDQKYRRLFEAGTDAIVLLDGDSHEVLDANPSALTTYGYSLEQFRRLKLEDLSTQPEASITAIRETLETGMSEIPLRYHRRHDGTQFPVEISAFTIHWKGRRVVCGVVRDISKRLSRERALADQRMELRRLASELSLAGERERQRIAASLHDELGQILTACRFRIDLARNAQPEGDPDKNLESASIILEQAIEATRAMTFELSCPMLNELGLAPALEELCADLGRESNVELIFQGDPLPFALSEETGLVLYRCTRELLVNALKHAEAKQVRVRLERCVLGVRIRVEDNGNGFDASGAGTGFSPTGGFGLFNTREYMQHLGGTLDVTSSPQRGTRATLDAPAQPPPEQPQAPPEAP